MSVRVTQDVLEVLRNATPNLRVTQDVLEVLRNATPNLRVTQDVLEVLRNATPNLRVTQVVVEVLRSSSTNPTALTNFVAVSPAAVAKGSRTKPVSSSVSVAPSVVVANLRDVSASNSVTVAQSVTGHTDSVTVSLTSPVTVTPAVTPRPDNVRITVSQPVTVTPAIGHALGDHEIHVVQGVSVSESAAGRNNNVRMGVVTSISASEGETDTIPDRWVFLSTPASVSQVVAPVSTHPHISHGITVGTLAAVSGAKYQSVTHAIRAYLPDNVAARTHVDPTRLVVAHNVQVADSCVRDLFEHYVSASNHVNVDPTVLSKPTLRFASDHATVLQSVAIGGGRRINLAASITASQRVGGNLFAGVFEDDITVLARPTPKTPLVSVRVKDAVHIGPDLADRVIPAQRIVQSIRVGHSPHLTDTTIPVTTTIHVSPSAIPRNDNQRITHTISVCPWPPFTPGNNITVSQSIHFTYDRRLVDTLAPTDSLGSTWRLHRTLLDTVTPTDSMIHTAVLNRTLFDALPIQEPSYLKPIPFLDHPVPVPILQYHLIGSHVANYTLLQCSKGAIVLPAPLLGDTLDNVATVEVKRSMSGKALFFKQSSTRQSLHMTFRLDFIKALELRRFLVAGLSETMTLITWDGRQYVGFITNSPFEISNDGRAAPALEYSTIDLEFEGTRL